MYDILDMGTHEGINLFNMSTLVTVIPKIIKDKSNFRNLIYDIVPSELQTHLSTESHILWHIRKTLSYLSTLGYTLLSVWSLLKVLPAW